MFHEVIDDPQADQIENDHHFEVAAMKGRAQPIHPHIEVGEDPRQNASAFGLVLLAQPEGRSRGRQRIGIGSGVHGPEQEFLILEEAVGHRQDRLIELNDGAFVGLGLQNPWRQGEAFPVGLGQEAIVDQAACLVPNRFAGQAGWGGDGSDRASLRCDRMPRE